MEKKKNLLGLLDVPVIKL